MTTHRCAALAIRSHNITEGECRFATIIGDGAHLIAGLAIVTPRTLLPGTAGSDLQYALPVGLKPAGNRRALFAASRLGPLSTKFLVGWVITHSVVTPGGVAPLVNQPCRPQDRSPPDSRIHTAQAP